MMSFATKGQIFCENRGKKKMKKNRKVNGSDEYRSEILKSRRELTIDSESNSDEKVSESDDRITENSVYRNEEVTKEKILDRIEAVTKSPIPEFPVNLSGKCPLVVSLSELLPSAFQEFHTFCWHTFQMNSSKLNNEMLEQCAAITYATVRLLYHIGYNPERIAVSGLHTLMVLAGKGALKLDDACLACKTIASLMSNDDDSMIVEEINEILMELNINFQKTSSLINFKQSTLPDTASITAAILTNEEQNQQFLNYQVESCLIFGFKSYQPMKHFEKLDDFVASITSNKDPTLLDTLQKALLQSKQKLNLTCKGQLYQSRELLQQCRNVDILNVQLKLKKDRYLYDHLVHNRNILSASTLLITIYNALSSKWNIFNDVTFLFPVIFTSQIEILNLEILISTTICTVAYQNEQCVNFQLGETFQRLHSGLVDFPEIDDSGKKLNERYESKVRSISGKDFYIEMEQYHYQHQKEFRCVRKLMINGDSGTVEFAPSEHLDVLIDGAMQAIVFIYLQQCHAKSITLVPFHIGRMEIVNIGEKRFPTGKCGNSTGILAFVNAKLRNGKLLGSFQFATAKTAIAAQAISFYPLKSDKMTNVWENALSSYQEIPVKPEMDKWVRKNESSGTISGNSSLIFIKSTACRLPKMVHDPAELWDALKTGQIMRSKIPCSRINGRDNLARGQYGHAVRCANFFSTDISQFDATFFGISRSEAEKIDPQQRILLECVYECMENAGMTSLKEAGFFVGFMSNEYPDVARGQDVVSMLGSSASVVSGRLNYLFGSTGPAITLDTACSSSLVALQAACHALLAGQCTTAIVAGVNLILTEQSIGQRANGNLLADDGICRSFDALSSGYGRADGCVALLLSTADTVAAGGSVSISSTCIGHNGQSVSLTAPNGFAQEKLLRDCLSKIQGNDESIGYWETHGTGTIIGDAIELKALQANLQQCLISSVKTHFGHSEAAAGVTGLAKILLQFQHEYIPEHGSYQFGQHLRDGSLYLPIVGEEWNHTLAGVSSFGISGTNAMTTLRSQKPTKSSRRTTIATTTTTMTMTTTGLQAYLCPISAKSWESLDMLMTSYQTMLENTTRSLKDTCSTAAFHRNHLQCRAIIFLHKGKIIGEGRNYDKCRKQEAIGLKLFSNSYLTILYWFYSKFAIFRSNFKLYFPLLKNFAKRKMGGKFQQSRSIVILTGILSLMTFLNDIGIEVKAFHACDKLSLIAGLLLAGKLKFAKLNEEAFSNMQIFKRNISNTKEYVSNYRWYEFDIREDRESFEIELVKMIGTSYLQGKCINWEYFYSLTFDPVMLPTYQFKRDSYWITERSSTIDHWLIGRLMTDEENECVFINQLSKMTNAEWSAFKFDGQVRLSFGICCEAIIEAFQQTFFKSSTKQLQNYSINDLAIIEHILHENDWIKTRIKKYAKDKYHVKLTCATNVIFKANIMPFACESAPAEVFNLTGMKNFITKSNFYEMLKKGGITYDGIYQTITQTTLSEKIFKAKCCNRIFLVAETMVQVACYCNLANPSHIYGKMKFTIANLNLSSFLSESLYLAIESNQIIAYNVSNHQIVTTINLSAREVNGKLDDRKECGEGRLERISSSGRGVAISSATTYQGCLAKVRQAVDDIRKDNCPINDQQLSLSFIELGLDSLAITDLANRLSTMYFPHLQIGAVDLFNYANISSLTDAIYKCKISSRFTGKEEKHVREKRPMKDFNFATALNGGRSREKYFASRRIEDGNCAYQQIFVKNQRRTDCLAVIITDKMELIKRRKLENELIIVVCNERASCGSAPDKIGIFHLNIRNAKDFKHYIASHINGHEKVMVKFKFSKNISLENVVKVLLQLTRVIVQCTNTFIISSKVECGRANAFALGFAKSLCAELYPKVQYEWNFVLQQISNLTEFIAESPALQQSGWKDRDLEERWLITGGLGGIGWQMAKFIAYNRKVSHLILLGRKGPNETQRREMKKMRDSVGVDVRAVSVDLTSKMQMKEFFDKLGIPLTGVIHSAGCVHDALVAQQNLSTFRSVMEAKCNGLLMLEKFCRNHPIRHFIVNSSISAIIGNRGQCNYSAANAYIDEIMLERRAKGSPATIINWGNWLETGMAIKTNKVLQKMGFIGLMTQKAMSYLQIAIEQAPVRIIVIQVDIRKILHYRPDLSAVLLNKNTENDTLTDGMNVSKQALNGKNRSLKQSGKNVKKKDGIDENDNDCLKSVIAKTVAEITGEVVNAEDYQRSFMDLGLDSLKLYQFTSGLMKKITFKPILNVLAIFENPTINKLSQYISSGFFRMKENPENVTANIDDNFRLKKRENLKNLIENFKIFIFYSNDQQKLSVEKLQFFDLFDQSGQILAKLSNKSFTHNPFNGSFHVVWGFKYQILRNNFSHFQIIPNFQQSRKPIICFMVSGQGSQVWNMGKQLSCIFPFFRKKFVETLGMANRYMSGTSITIRDILFQWHYRDLLYKTEYSQPIIFCFAYSLAKLYEFCGVKADFFVGHSIGELVACALANRISLDDALKLVVKRGQILSSTRGKGKMIAVKVSDAEKLQRYSGMDRAAENSNEQIVLSGDNQSARLCLRLARLYRYTVTVIDNCYPFHSSAIDDSLEEQYRRECKKMKIPEVRKRRRDVVNNCTGEFMDPTTDTIASITSTVFFSKCVETLRKNQTNVWIEIGNGVTLKTMVSNMLESTGPDTLICSAISNDKQEVHSFIQSLCQLQTFGVKIKWNRIVDDAKEIMMNEKQSTGTGTETDPELLEQHLINGEITLPAAFIITMFANYSTNSSQKCCSKLKLTLDLREKEFTSERKMIILEALWLEKRVNEIDLSKLEIKFNSSELILADNTSKYSSCRIGTEDRLKILKQLKQLIAIKKLRLRYDGLKMRMAKLSHQEFYETMRTFGLQYGLKYQVLREIYRKGRYISATMINTAGDLTRLLDGALQLLSAALCNNTCNTSSTIYIPFAIDDIVINYDPTISYNSFNAYGIITKRTDNLIKGSVIIYEGDNEVIVLHNVTAIHIGTNSSIKHSNPADSRHSPDSIPRHPIMNEKNFHINSLNNLDGSSTNGNMKNPRSSGEGEKLQIEIVSYVGEFPGSATDCASLWNDLKTGKSSHSSRDIRKLESDTTKFNPAKFGITPKEAIYIDPQQRILLDMAQKTIEKAGLDRLDSKTGVFIGVSSSDFAQKAYKEIDDTCSYLSTGTNQSVLAGRIAYWFDLKGPAMVIDTACSSFFSALVVACDNIRAGSCPAALVGTANIILNSKSTSVLENARMLSKTGSCKVFDVDADGYVRSEGAAMILIKGEEGEGSDRSEAIDQDDMKLTIKSYGMGHNGRTNGVTVPSGLSESELINRICKGNRNMSSISWVECHATGTPLGDPIETEAIVKALANRSSTDQPIHITSAKSSIGHCEAAASALSLIMALQAYKHHYLPPIQHFKLLNTNILSDRTLVVPVIGEELPDSFDMLINSFGFSGTNVSVVLSGCRRKERKKDEKASNFPVIKRKLTNGHLPSVILCSANDPESLKLNWEKLEKHMEQASCSIQDVCSSLQNLRSAGRLRIAMPIKRNAQKWKSFRMPTEPQKWTKVVFNMEGNPEPTMIAELCIVYRSFRKIFRESIKIYKNSNNFTSSKRNGQIVFEFISKLSLITFLLRIGINPSVIVAPSGIDRAVVEVIRRKCKMKSNSGSVLQSQKGMSSCRGGHFEVRQEMFANDFDCIFDMQTLRIEQPESDRKRNSWKQSFTNEFAITTCQLYEHFIDINWHILNDRITKFCPLPDPECSKQKYWPFIECNIESVDDGLPHGESSSSGLQPIMLQNIGSDDEANSIIADQPGSNDLGDNGIESINNRYLYKLFQRKCKLPYPERFIPFIAVNLTDTTTIIGQNAIFISKLNDDNDMRMIKGQVDLTKCTTLVMEWTTNEENLLESTVRQSMLVINLWEILANNSNSSNYLKTKPCLIIFAIIKGDNRSIAPFSALLKTLAMERKNVNFKSIHTDRIDQKLFHEILDENFCNEIIYYRGGDRYVERLQQVDSTELIAQQKNIDRILITGNIRGIAGKLIEDLKPNLAVVVSRTTTNTCESVKDGGVIRTIQTDCTNFKEMAQIFATFAPFDLIFHCAAIIENGLMENMNVKLFETVCRPKVVGLQNIIKLSREFPVRKVVAFSSAATVLGSVGQANYVVANELVEYLMRKEMPEGLFISWGPWDGRGLLAGKEMAAIRQQIQNNGWKLLQVEQVAQLCCKLLPNRAHHIAMDVNFNLLRKKYPYLRNFLDEIPENNINIHNDGLVLQNAARQSDSESRKYFKETIINCISVVSGIADVRIDLGFMTMGIDSLMIAELHAMLQERLNINISVSTLYEYSTVETLAEFLMENFATNCKLHDVRRDERGSDEIAIIGYSGAFSGSSDDQTFWHSLLDGKELIEQQQHKRIGNNNDEITEAVGIVPDMDKFDYRFWNLSPDDASYIDPQIRKFVEHSYIALERSGLIRVRRELRVAVVVGAEPSGYRGKSRRIGGIEDLYEVNQKDFVATWTSHLLDLHGASFAVYSACSTALVAIVQAANLLRQNQCDVALAGAVSLALPHGSGNLQGMVLSSDGHCRPFDHKSGGTVRGSAVGVVVLRRISDVRQANTPMVLKISGYGITNDGLLKSSFMAPNISGQRRCIKEAVEMAGEAEVDYIECHGTGTTTGDLIELTAMSQLYHRDTVIGSVKANIGHALAGAGIASVIKLCKIAEKRIIPKQINFEKLNGNLTDVGFTITKCNMELEEKKLRFAVNGSGIGGINAHIIMETDSSLVPSDQPNINQYFYALTISGKTKNACMRLRDRIVDYLNPEMNLSQIASTLQNYREHFEYRIGVSVRSVMDAAEQLRNYSKLEKVTGLKRENVAFYYAPQGLEYPNMGLEALACNEVYRKVLQKCCRIATNLIGIDFQSIIFPGQNSAKPNLIVEQPFSQMATFIVSFSLAEQLNAWGIEGCMMLGHSLGEYVAAAQAEVFDVEIALKILYKRGCLIAKTEKAKMLVVKCTNDVEFSKIPDGIEVCANLRSGLICSVGKPTVIEEFKKKLLEEEVDCRELTTNYGFHSSFMDSILVEFAQFLENFTFQKPKKQILSNIDGEVIKYFDAKYMVEHMRRTIRIDKCIDNLPAEIKVIIEIGPKGILGSLLRDNKRRKIEVISTIPSRMQHEKDSDCGDLLGLATKLWMKGYELNWATICGDNGFDRFLPNYQFEKDICWENQEEKRNPEKLKMNLYEPCWVPYKFTGRNRRQFPEGVLLFTPEALTKPIETLLTMLHNLFIPVRCILSDTASSGNVTVRNGSIYINPNQEESYQQLVDLLHNDHFHYDTIVHAWNFAVNNETERINNSHLLSGFYSIYWIMKNVMQNVAHLTILICIDWNTEPEMYTVLGPLRELTMRNGSVKAACILCTPEVDLFNGLQLLLQSVQPDFSLIRNSMNDKFEYFSYQMKPIENFNYFMANENGSIALNDCVIRNADVIVIFGFGDIGRSFVNVLSENFDSLTICIASPNAKCHFREYQNEINRWKSCRNFEKSRMDEEVTNVISAEHTIVAYDVDVTKGDEVRQLLIGIMSQHKQINVVIHAAARKVESIKIEKNFDEMNFLMEPKIGGTRNIIDNLYENNISIRSLVLNSSMNALFGLPGGCDYAASNIFLDAFSGRNVPNIQNITTIQWTGWKESRMLNDYAKNHSGNPVAKLIMDYSLSVKEAELVIWKCLHERGLIAASFLSPNDIVREIRKLSLTVNRKFAATIPEGELLTVNCNDLRTIVARIWMNYLGVDEIANDDDFFQLGGHSLNGMQIIWEINGSLKINCKLDHLFLNSKFDNFLQFIQELNIKDGKSDGKFLHDLESYKVLDNAGRMQEIPLSYPQENMLILRQLQHATLYNISFLITFHGSVCTRSLRKALLHLISRQTSLRTRFSASNDQYHQEIQSLTESYYHIAWPSISECESRELVENEKKYVFDLNYIPFQIISMCCKRNDSDEIEYLILINQHHIITDGWSMTTFANELSEFYRYCLTNQSIPEGLRNLSWNVTHFAVWQRSDEYGKMMEDDLQRLCIKLEGLQATRIVPQKISISMNKLINQKTFRIPTSLWTEINQTAKKYQQTIYTVMLTAFLCLIRKFSDDYDNNTMVIGCPVSGRTGAEEMKSVIGYFLNNIILVVENFKTNASNSELFDGVRKAIQDARSFEHIPFHRLVAKLSHQRRSINQYPIFDIFFNYRHNLDFPKINIPGIRTTIKQLTANDVFNFSFTVDETDDGILITVNYDANQYTTELIVRMINVYFKLLKSICNQSDSLKNAISDLGSSTIHRDITSGSIIDIIDRQSMQTDKLIAFSYLDERITYRQMNHSIHIFAKTIRQFYLQNNCEHIRADTIIPICADSNAMIVALLSVQRIGAAYAPIDPANSTTMIAELVHDIGASMIIVQGNNLPLDIPILPLILPHSSLNDQGCHIDDLEGSFEMNHLGSAASRRRAQSSDLSYVIFTSGSTGKPKAVCVTNRNLLNFVFASTQQATFHPNYRIYHSVNTIFDVSCVNIFTTLSNGCCLIGAENILNLTVEIIRKKIQFAFIPSALFNMLDSNQIVHLQQLEKLFVGGETPNNEQLRRCLKLGIHICQIYGPTEATVWSLSNKCTMMQYECGRMIGTTIDNETVYLLDSEGHLACDGAKGILVICGEGVARGYLNQEIDHFFKPNKFHTKEDELLKRNMLCYHTGDYAMKLDDKYHFLGRSDKQLKIRGYRVEPGEIEIVVREWDSSIRNVAVLKNNQLDSLFLFIEKEETVSEYFDGLRRYLQQNLLHFMIPKKIIILQRMPLNRSGKIDRSALTEMMINNYPVDDENLIPEIVPGTKGLLERVRDIWCQLLAVSEVQPDHDFFLIGGHSLLLVLLRQKLHDKFNFDFNLEQFYRQPTLSALVGRMQTTICNNVAQQNERSSHQVYQNQAILQSSPSAISNPINESIQFVNLRETESAYGNVYMIHAIAGTVYPYFALISTIPQHLNIYAIQYELHYPSDSLMQLALFYSKQIAKHSQMKRIHLMGHSLGGILAREIAELLNDDDRSIKVSFVIMLDSWCIGIGNLNFNTVQSYLKEKLKGFPGEEEYLKKSAKLTELLQKHQFFTSSIKIYLLKAMKHGNSPLRTNLNGPHSEEKTRSMITNGWHMFSTKNVDIFLVDGDHDSMLQQNNTTFLTNIFAHIYAENHFVFEHF